MKKIINKTKIGASLSALAFSLYAGSALAQTCTPPPECEALGFTKTEADCAGKTILKCPFNDAMVYCPGYQEATKGYAVGDSYTVNGVAVGKVIEVSDCVMGGSDTPDSMTVQQCITNSGCTSTTGSYVASRGVYRWTCQGTGKVVAESKSNSEASNVSLCNYSSSTCAHGVVSTIATRYAATKSEASAGCASMSSGGLSWFLPTSDQVVKIHNNMSFSGSVWSTEGCAVGNGYSDNETRCINGQQISIPSAYFCVAAF